MVGQSEAGWREWDNATKTLRTRVGQYVGHGALDYDGCMHE